jgi:hypothetical protein
VPRDYQIDTSVSSLPAWMQDSPAGTYTPTTYQGQAGYLDPTGQIISGTGAVLYRPPGWQEKIDAINAAHPSQNFLQTMGSGISAMASNPVVQAGALLGAGAYFLGPVAADLFGGAAGAGGAGGGSVAALAPDTVAALTVAPEVAAATAPTALTPAAIESLTGTAGYGANASALAAAEAAASGATTLGGIATIAPEVAASGAGLTTGGAGAAGMGGGAGLTAITNADLAAGGALTAGAASAAGMGGGTGLTALPNIGAAAGAPLALAGTSLADMGGGTGLTVPAAGGGTVTANGVIPPITNPNISVPDLVSAANTAANAAANGDTSLLDKLKNVTGLTGPQLAALLSGATGALTAANTSSAIGQGLKAQQEATTASQGILKDIYNQQLGFQKPYQATGVNALNQLGQLGGGQYQQYDPVTGQPTTMGTGTGYLTHQFDKNDLAAGLAPNYDFMLQQGQMANQRAANVGGGALSGNTLQSLQNYTQNYAGNAYQNAFQNYQTQRNNIYNNLSNMAGIGQTANTGAANAGTSYGTGVTGLNTGLANATAASILGQAQVAAGGANSAANATFLSSLLGQTGKVPATTPTTA